MIGIYKITSPTKKIYIGQSINIEKRWCRYKNLECSSQPALYNSFKKHGADKHKFEIICECEIDELNDKERYYQDLYSVIKQNGLNCILTPVIGARGVMSEETKRKISISNTGKVLSEETKAKCRIANLGKKRNNPPTQRMINLEIAKSLPKKKKVVSQETKEKLRKANLGVAFTEIRKTNISKGLTGRKLSEEHKFNISLKSAKWNLGKKLSEETKLKISKNNKMKRKIINTDTLIVYNSIKEASEKENIKYIKLREIMCSNKNNTNLKYFDNE